MENYFTQEPVLISFEKIYNQNIVPKIQAIDLYLKTESSPFAKKDVAKLLEISEEELAAIMNKYNIVKIARLDFFKIIVNSSSYICGLINRQWQYVTHTSYTPEMIAYIYEINLNKVTAAFDELDCSSVCDEDLHHIFKRIYMPVFNVL
ncbi:MAG: hypothetical protein AB9856_11015 [Cellulosilyticaceae bacterium]